MLDIVRDCLSVRCHAELPQAELVDRTRARAVNRFIARTVRCTTVTDDELCAPPSSGRVFGGRRTVQLGDVSPGGRLRLDAIARVLQDIANDDSAAAGFDRRTSTWIVRRTRIEVERFPCYLAELDVRTWCSGTGSRWAERRTDLVADDGGLVRTATIWVAVDASTGRPVPLGERFHEVYGPSTQGRRVRANLRLDRRPDPVDGRPWPLRFADFDVLGHVNNANYWQPVEDELARRRDLRAPMAAVVEYGDPLLPGTTPDLAVVDREDGLDGWIGDSAAFTVRSRT